MDKRTLVNGQYCETISTDDRGFNYGDGVFETISVRNGKPLFLQQHLQRLEKGLDKLTIPKELSALSDDIERLLADTTVIPDAVLKIIVTRGNSLRGYKPEHDAPSNRVVSISSALQSRFPDKGVTLRLCDSRLSLNPALAGIKHLCRIEQVLARSEWTDPAIHEGIMLDINGRVVEGTMSNIFLIKDSKLYTPNLEYCGVSGIVRGLILDSIAPTLSLEAYIEYISLENLLDADEVFISNSLIGIIPVETVVDRHYTSSIWTEKIISVYQGLAYE